MFYVKCTALLRAVHFLKGFYEYNKSKRIKVATVDGNDNIIKIFESASQACIYYGRKSKEAGNLLNNCNKIIPIYKCLQVYNLYLLFLIFLLLFPFIYLYLISRYALLLLIPFLGFIIYIYVRLSKPCLIITAEKIIYYGFHPVKEINLTDITKIEFLIHRNRYKMMIDPSCHDLIFYNKNNKILKYPNIYYDDFNRISAKVKPYNIKILRR